MPQAERVLKTDYWAAIDARVVRPLGLQSTGLNYSAPGVQGRLAPGYDAALLPPLPFGPLGYDGPAGGAYSTAADLNTILQAIAGAAAGEVTPLGLPPATARDFLKPMWISDDATFQQGTPWESACGGGLGMRGSSTPPSPHPLRFCRVCQCS